MARDRPQRRSWWAQPISPVVGAGGAGGGGFRGPAQPGWRDRFAEADRGWWEAMQQRLSDLVRRPGVAGWLAGSPTLGIVLAQQQEAELAQQREDILRQRWTPRAWYPSYEDIDAQMMAEAGLMPGDVRAQQQFGGAVPQGAVEAYPGAAYGMMAPGGGAAAPQAPGGIAGAGTMQMAPVAPGPAGTPSAVYGLASYATAEWWDAFTGVHGQEPSEWYSQPDKRYPGMTWQQSANEDAAWARAILQRNIRMGVGATGPSPGEWQQHYWQMKRVPEQYQYFRPQPSAQRPWARPLGMPPLERG